MGSGTSSAGDAATAGRAAADAALAGRDADLLIVFATPALDLEEMVAAIAAAAPAVPMVGCTTAGEFTEDGPSDGSVVVAAIGGGFQVRTARGEHASADLAAAGAAAASCVDGEDTLPHQALLLLSDGLSGDQEEIVRGVYSMVGARVPLVGGCAGDDLQMSRTHQFHDGEVLTDAVVAASISSEGPLGIGVQHGWTTVGEPVLVTSSTGNRVRTLDDEPALDVYLDRLEAPAEAREDPAAFTQFAQSRPFGLDRRTGKAARFVAGADFDDRSLSCIANVPEGAVVWFMEGDSQSVIDASDAACQQALEALDGPPAGMLAFDCIGRRDVLGHHVGDEVARIRAHAAGAPLAGFYTYGEIARTRGVTGFHNQTLVVLGIG